MYGVLLPVTGLAVGLYAVIAVTSIIVGSLMRMKRREKNQS